MIPKTIHFIFGLDKNFGKIPFSYYHYLSVLSAKKVNVGYEIVLHYHYEPVGNEWWEKTKLLVTMDKVSEPPTTICGKPVFHPAHKTDMLRIEILYADGGVYLDMDTLCIKPFDPFLSKRFVMGLEVHEGQVTGMCNAVILSEKDYLFLAHWHGKLPEFDAYDWNKMACRVPLQLSRSHAELIHIEPPESFFRLTWSDQELKAAHEEVLEFNRSYSMHLWETCAYTKYLSKITEEDIRSRDSTYNILARRILD